jgi:hypothetical protein
MGTPLVVTCSPTSIPQDPPSVSIPNFGILEMAFDGLTDLPDPGDMLVKFQSQLGTAMAPVRRYLEIVESFQALQDCMNVIPKCIIKLDPDPFYDCLKNLYKAVARLLAFMPPFSYVVTGLNIASYCIDLIDAIVTLMQRIDSKLETYVQLYDEATSLGDTDLVRFVNCAISQTTAELWLVMKVLKFIGPLQDALMEMFIRTTNLKMLEDGKKKYDDCVAFFAEAGEAIANGEDVPDFEQEETDETTLQRHTALTSIPRMSTVVTAMNYCRSATVVIYNTLAPLMGYDPNKTVREMPVFVHL